MLTSEILRALWPRAPQSVIKGVIAAVDDVSDLYGLNTPLRWAHFMAQISHECGAGTIVRENMNYSAKRLMEIFGVGRHSAKITEAEAARLAGKPQEIAERVYGLGNPSKAKELGNTTVGDGYRYRGNGMLQLTGRGSHKRVGERVGYDLEVNPAQLENPTISFKVAAAEFQGLNCLPAADADDVALVTRRVNGGRNGLSERTVWLRKWKTALDGVEEPAWRPRAAPPVEAKPLLSSNIFKGAATTAGSIAVSGGAKVLENANTTTSTVSVQDVADKVQQASDAVTTISVAKDNALAVVQTVKPVLGVGPSIWATVAVVALCIAAVAIGYTMWERYKKLRDQGV